MEGSFNLNLSVLPKLMLVIRAMFEQRIESDPKIAEFRVDVFKVLGDFSTYLRHTSLR
jgi:hypothetical protein